MLLDRVSIHPETDPENFRIAARAIRKQFDASGTKIADWARERGLNPKYVSDVLAGKRACTRGQGHRIAVALGLKPEVPPPGVEASPREERLDGVRK